MIEQINPDQLPAWFDAIREHGEPLLLDVREPAEWNAASVSLPGAELLQMSMQTIPSRLAEFDPDRPVAVLCHHGARSMNVAVFLTRQGFAHVVNIAGGIDAWSLQFDPSVPRY
ncbi:rhodanese-like domain-containing protein [Ottowia thiooxydans]|uniref:rhodanese-like domain-containing protein n=1 Tax=Ottowia thiooxydans TaxID=219182 RepID=UPI000420155D|nr:rhodanese-like domain-containing protein [Ottowia thiooxydans]